MNNHIYKTEDGRNIVETLYRKVLAKHSTPPFEQFVVPTETAKTHVLRFGNAAKPPLVMVHGSASNSAVWLGSISYFVEHFCVYCVDIPGEPGLSEPIRSALGSEAPYTWFVSLLDNLNIRKSFFLSMSLGSWYVMNFAIKNPERIHALSMLTTPGIVPAKTSFIFKVIVFMMLGKMGQKLLNRTVFHKTEIPEEAIEYQSIVSKHFNPVMERIPVFTDAMLQNISAPVQYFGGDHDALLNSVKTGERITIHIPHSEIHILKDTGHVIINQFPVIRDFFIRMLS
jgi:pimeloyl-ACP methyl ester carboxylesterase